MRRILIIAVAAALAAPAAYAQQGVLPRLLADANKDGRVTSDEYTVHRRNFIMRADKNKDGRVSREEWKREAAFVRNVLEPTGVDGVEKVGKGGGFEAMDTNKDAFVAAGEVDAWAKARFTRFDLNKNGSVDRAEARQVERSIGR